MYLFFLTDDLNVFYMAIMIAFENLKDLLFQFTMLWTYVYSHNSCLVSYYKTNGSMIFSHNLEITI